MFLCSICRNFHFLSNPTIIVDNINSFFHYFNICTLHTFGNKQYHSKFEVVTLFRRFYSKFIYRFYMCTWLALENAVSVPIAIAAAVVFLVLNYSHLELRLTTEYETLTEHLSKQETSFALKDKRVHMIEANLIDCT